MTLDPMTLPVHLRPGPWGGQCDGCERMSWGGDVGETCTITQPNGQPCGGTIQGPPYWVERVAELQAVVDAILPLYHACNCLVGQADADSTVATVLTPALVAYEQAVTKGKGLNE